MISKPKWLLYAADVRVQLDNLPSRKSEKRFEERLLSTYKVACAEKGYRGSFSEWEYLLHRLGA